MEVDTLHLTSEALRWERQRYYELMAGRSAEQGEDYKMCPGIDAYALTRYDEGWRCETQCIKEALEVYAASSRVYR